MPQESHVPNLPPETQEYFAYLKRKEKAADWFLVIYLIAVLLLFIFGTIVHLFWL